MTFLIGMPGGAEWIIIFLFIFIMLVIPIFTIVLFLQNRTLKKQVITLTEEKKALLDKLLEGE